jgi:hypothetical protein
MNAAGKAVHSVVVTIDNHETILRFDSKEDAERFAQAERARLAEDEKIASQRVREIAYRLWQEEGYPEGEALRHWFAAKAIFDSEAQRARWWRRRGSAAWRRRGTELEALQ